MSNRRYFLQKIVGAGVGATVLQFFDFGESSSTIALAQSTNSQNVTRFNLFPRLIYDYLSPVFNGVGQGLGSFYRGVGEGAGDVARGVGEGLRIRLRDGISGAEGKQKLQEYALNQNAKIQREIVELMRDSLREYQAKQIELKLTEFQANWDLENWTGILSRQETEDLLREKKDCLLVLFSPPTISPDAPSSIRNNLPIDLESVGTTLAKYYPDRNKQYAVKFYSGYFKRAIGDITVEQLHKILSPIPTAVFFMDITDYACRFNVGFWGIQGEDVSIVSSPLWDWEKTKKELISSGVDEVDSLRTIRQSMVNGNQLLASYLVDSYYLSLDPYYQLQFPKVSAKLAQELTNDLAEKGVAQESIKPYVAQLQGIQQQEQQIYEEELKAIVQELQEKLAQKAQNFTEDLGNGIKLEMVAIEGGEFLMGSPSSEVGRGFDESPQHRVTVPTFYMGKFEVTQAQWRAIASFPQIERYLDPDPSFFKGDNRPVERVSWLDAVEFCKRLSRKTGREYRLPSEAEWEYACRAGTATPFYFGETITTALANYNGNFTYANGSLEEYRQSTTPVGQFSPNAFGLYDMHGNVWEWCADNYHTSYYGAPTDGSAWIDEIDNNNQYRILRGGSWNFNPEVCRSAFRFRIDPDYRDDYNSGFRVVW